MNRRSLRGVIFNMINKPHPGNQARPRQVGKRSLESLSGTEKNKYFENRVRKTLKLNVVALKISGLMR